jgi:hypothetical protein
MDTRRGQVQPRIGQLQAGGVVGLQKLAEGLEMCMATLKLSKEFEELSYRQRNCLLVYQSWQTVIWQTL